MRITLPNTWRQQFIFITIMAMLLNLFTTRALLSVSMIMFIIACCVHKNIRSQLINFFKTPLLISMAFLFLLPFISGLWSSNLHKWADVVRIKLPLLLLPVAFAGNWQLTSKQWNTIATIFLMLILAATCWSLFQYLGNMQSINQNYLKAKTIATPLENDHVRFSWLVCIAAIIGVKCSVEEKSKKAQIAFVLLAVGFMVYLHILAARTGLLALYIFLLLLTIDFLIKKRNIWYRWLSIFLLILLPVTAWFLLPTFQNRIKYFVYDFSYIKSNQYLPGGNDGNRVLSLKAGWDILKHHPFGVGAGDVQNATNQWYHINTPYIALPDQLALPSSEWLIYGAATGWVGIILFTIVMFVPLFIPNLKSRFFWFAVTITAGCSFLLDIGLEVQFGVFIYTFIILWCYKWFSLENNPVK